MVETEKVLKHRGGRVCSQASLQHRQDLPVTEREGERRALSPEPGREVGGMQWEGR